jgi:uncharacterized protein YjbI with pentapeptide repeats
MRRNLIIALFGALICALALTTIPSVAGASPSVRKPGAPTALVLTPVNTAIAVSWSAPISDGGSPVVSYVVKVKGSSPCVSTGPTSCIASGLRNGRSYSVKVQAVNVRGRGHPARFFAVPTTAQNCAYVGAYANLQNCNNPNLFAANLANANLSGANLSNNSLYYTNFTGANLTGANLTGAGASNANFTNANLTAANLTNADLYQATVVGTTLTDATLTGANLNDETSSGISGTPSAFPSGWSLVGGFLIGPGADLLGQNLSGLNLTGTDLTGASLYFTDLAGATLTNANLTSVGASNANFTGATLTNANLTNGDLYSATFTGATLTGVTWSNTECPDSSNSDTNGSSPDSCVGYGI